MSSWVEADALNPATLPAALAGCRVAYYLVHSMAAGRDFGRLDREAALNFAQARLRRPASSASSISADSCPRVQSPSTSCRAPRAATCCVRRTVPVTEIRAGIIVGAGSAAYEVMRDLVYHLPLMVTPKWVQSKSSPIALDNLLYVPRARRRRIPAAAGRIFDAGGPEIPDVRSR